MKKLSFCLLISSILWVISSILFFSISTFSNDSSSSGGSSIINSVFLFFSIIAGIFWVSIIWRIYKLEYYDTWVLTLSSILGALESAFFGYYLAISSFSSSSSWIITLVIIFVGLISSFFMLLFSGCLLIVQTRGWVNFTLKLRRRLFRNKKNLIFPDKITEKIIFVNIDGIFPSKTASIYKAVFIACKVSSFKIEVAEYIFAVKNGMVVKIFKFRDQKFRGIEINQSNLNAVRSRYNRFDLNEKDIGSFVLNITATGVPKILNKSYLNRKLKIDKIKGDVSYNF